MAGRDGAGSLPEAARLPRSSSSRPTGRRRDDGRSRPQHGPRVGLSRRENSRESSSRVARNRHPTTTRRKKLTSARSLMQLLESQRLDWRPTTPRIAGTRRRPQLELRELVHHAEARQARVRWLWPGVWRLVRTETGWRHRPVPAVRRNASPTLNHSRNDSTCSRGRSTGGNRSVT